MKTETQASADLAHIAEMIDGIHIAMVTTLESDGSQASRPMASTVTGKPIAMGEHGTHTGLSSASAAPGDSS